MATKYWIKLYIEILHDPKMIRLSDSLFSLTIKLFLVAGEYDDGGYLPPIDDIAIILRADAESLETEMIELQRVGILSTVGGRWMVSKFAERQAAVSTAERMRQYRDRKQKQQYYGDVTNRNVETESDTESDTEADKTKNVFAAYTSSIGALAPTIAENIKSLLIDYPSDWITESFEIAARNNKRSLSYAEAILKRWEREGKDDGKQKQAANLRGYSHG